jgi:hypothetical protein
MSACESVPLQYPAVPYYGTPLQYPSSTPPVPREYSPTLARMSACESASHSAHLSSRERSACRAYKQTNGPQMPSEYPVSTPRLP